MKKVSAVIVAAGEGRRFGAAKQFALLQGKPVLDWSLETFNAHPGVDEIILVVPDVGSKKSYPARYEKIAVVIKGGQRRQDSVNLGFRAIDPRRTDIILVHDGARPLAGQDLVDRVIEQTREKGAVVPGLLLEETIKEAAHGEVLVTLDRTRLFRVQTPQGFFYPLLARALEKAYADHFYGTDEAALVERLGERVFIIDGDPRNIKITVPLDLKMAEALLAD
jgi:2-C-methyl-D-erythritol 4-phosphate cytidylyltransferase